MKEICKRCLLALLKIRAAKVIRAAKKIIIVTGSIGKTTAKEAIAWVLQDHYDLLVAAESFNTPFGVTLTLLGEKESGFNSVSKWLGILWRAWTRKLHLPEVIILEYGVDRPGDMDELLSIARPDYAVVTTIAPVHLGPKQFQNMEEISTEKMKLARAVKTNGSAILNFDNALIRSAAHALSARILSYGETDDVLYQIEHLTATPSDITFTVRHEGESADCTLSLYGVHLATTILPALIVGKELGLNLTLSAQKLRNFIPPPGRGRILKGQNDSTIWDSSYNSNPVATEAALRTLREIPAKRRLALLGNMNELGAESGNFHQALGRAAAESADLLFFVGPEFESFRKGAMGKEVRQFANAEEAGKYIRTILQSGDVLLAKGSQNGVFLERAVKEMLADPHDAALLCRQSAEWNKK